jgi:hypothetical protein
MKEASMGELLKAAREVFSRWGKKGGTKSSANMTPEQRTARARKAANARWDKRKAGK